MSLSNHSIVSNPAHAVYYRCESRLSGTGGVSLSECEELMSRLKDKYPAEYKVVC